MRFVLLKNVLKLLEELASLRIVAVSKRIVELIKKLLLLTVKTCRNFEEYPCF